MFMRILILLAFVVSIPFSRGMGEILYTISSPNEENSGFFGTSVSEAGDTNGDGHPDIIIGASWENPGSSPTDAGRAYIFNGLNGVLLHTLISPNEEQSGYFGISVSGAGDVNGDTYDDVIVGASYEDPGSSPEDAGRAYIFNGLTGTLIHTLTSPNEEVGGRFGVSVSDAGDVNVDGYADVIVGAWCEDPGSSPEDAGRAYIFNGNTGILLHTLVSPNEETDGHFGASVSGAGNVDGRGSDAVVVGAPNEDPGSSPEDAGRAYVFGGETAALIQTFFSGNEEESGGFGGAVAGVGDVDGDGYDDVAVGAEKQSIGIGSSYAGRVYIFAVMMGIPLHNLISPNAQEYGFFGSSVAKAGDVNGNGHNDIIVGAFGEAWESGPTGAGQAYVFDGGFGLPLYTLRSPNEQQNGFFGISVSGTGDVNGDGRDDVVIGANREDSRALPFDVGHAYVSSWMYLMPELYGGNLTLEWSSWFPATEYWIYGADNSQYFLPDLSPSHENRLDVVTPPTNSWVSTNGIGDPDHNWSYIILAIDALENELARSNAAGTVAFRIQY